MPATARYPRDLSAGSPTADPLRTEQCGAVVAGLMSVARHRLGMELAVITRRVADVLVVEHYDGDIKSFGITVGTTANYERARAALEGHLPQVVRYAGRDGRTADPALARRAGIGSYVVAPVLLPDGSVYGSLACMSHNPDPALRDRDASFLALIAGALSNCVSDHRGDWLGRDRVWRRISRLIDDGGPAMVFQPIYDRATLDVAGVEALARCPDTGPGSDAAGTSAVSATGTSTGPGNGPGAGGLDESSPQRWFADAASVGLGVELEIAAIRNALTALPWLPAGLPLSVNASPAAIVSGTLVGLLNAVPPERVIIEVTEHSRIDDYSTVRLALDSLRARGMRAALDDVGAGYAGLHQLLQLRPDIIKMDQSIIRKIEQDVSACRALATALVCLAEDIGATVLAEGVETARELEVLGEAGVHQVQGFLLARPGRLAAGPPPGTGGTRTIPTPAGIRTLTPRELSGYRNARPPG
ncbi:sensor domain-containing phosphodiesterase [Parafrankia discariae]|uniref:sensor domain-containing phosphodiesterase n=1 Tax=Parafrankia discariae TaxID=365528 RepID=UPI00035ED57A|nr:EAL domain-containing protein [Parafrankia discariae]